MTITIRFDHLFVSDSEGAGVRWPLDRLDDDLYSHVHGLLDIRIAGRALPRLGFFTPDDVCINAWVDVLMAAVRELSASDVASYVYDEGEQGQPAFRFDRRNDVLEVSVIDAVSGDGVADPSFQRVECRWDDFVREADALLAGVHAAVLAASPVEGAAWWARRSADNEPGQPALS